MHSHSYPPTHQHGAGNTLLYLGLSVLVIGGAVIAFLALRDSSEQAAPTAQEEQREQQALTAEPPPIKTVDLQQTEIARTSPQTDEGDTDKTSGQGLFERGGKAVPLTDGLAGGSEAADTPATVERTPNAVDAFDFGVLDGRVRVGVFGKGGIPDYKASVSSSQIVIRMPGDFRYVEQFSRTLQINEFGVGTARLERDSRGMRMSINLLPKLQHQPFLIADPKGLMVAFEPRG